MGIEMENSKGCFKNAEQTDGPAIWPFKARSMHIAEEAFSVESMLWPWVWGPADRKDQISRQRQGVGALNVRWRNLTYVLLAMRVINFLCVCVGKGSYKSNVLRTLFKHVLHDEQGEKGISRTFSPPLIFVLKVHCNNWRVSWWWSETRLRRRKYKNE